MAQVDDSFARLFLKNAGVDPDLFGKKTKKKTKKKAKKTEKKTKKKKTKKTEPTKKRTRKKKKTQNLRKVYTKAPPKRSKNAVKCVVCKEVHTPSIAPGVHLCSAECLKTYYDTTQEQIVTGWKLANSLRLFIRVCEKVDAGKLSVKEKTRPWQQANLHAKAFRKSKKYTSTKVVSVKKALRRITKKKK